MEFKGSSFYFDIHNIGFELEKKKILIVDDSHEFSFLVVSLMKFHDDIEIVSETSSLKASEIVEKSAFDLFIIDYLMDELNGLELIEKIKSTSLNKDRKCILLTAKDLSDSELTKLNEFNGLYTRKPIMPNEFYKQIIDIMNNE